MLELYLQYVFLTPVTVMLLAEIAKHTFEGLFHGAWFSHGGMPSSHSAFATSLMIVVGLHDGLESTTFAIAAVFGGIIWFDAAFVRSHIGRQGEVLNALQELQRFPERVGHSLMEVLGGIFFGAGVTSMIMSYLY